MKFQTPGKQDTVYWAVVGYARWWLNIDAGLCKLIGNSEGKLDAETLASIALQYNVARGLPGRNRPVETQAILDILNHAAAHWPSSMKDRAHHCGEITATLQSAKLTRNNHVSGVTKYMWFLSPAGWTVFDRFAADGMQVPSNLTALDRMKRFYAALDAAGFAEADQRLQSLIDKSAWNSLPSSRVFDTFLMRRSHEQGMRSGANSEDAIKGFLHALPHDAATSLHDLATTAQTELGKDLLPIRRGN